MEKSEQDVICDKSKHLLSHGNRKFYDIDYTKLEDEELYEKTSLVHENVASKKQDLLRYIHHNIIGNKKVFVGPFGKRKVEYCDYMASGRSLTFIEDYIYQNVLSDYGNTHTMTSVCSLQTTLFRHEARDIIRNAVNASEHDCIIFEGSGSTGAIHKLIHALDLQEPPVVIVGPFEHHSNLLPWREIGVDVTRVQESRNGEMDLTHLEAILKSTIQGTKKIICAFSAASNITGTLVDVNNVTVLCHKYNALVFWDYAAAAPYVEVDMNPVLSGVNPELVAKDAIFISTHKFIGGVQTPGILIAKKKLFSNQVPYISGGGTVFFVRRDAHRYLQEAELREEGGTPAIVESVRAGLVFQLKQAVGANMIMAREEQLVGQAFTFWENCPNLLLLGSKEVPRLAVFSFMVRHPQTGLYLHHNFVCALLNDLFGIQARGGCACAGPYAEDLLGIDEDLARRYEDFLLEDTQLDRGHLRRYREYSQHEILRPGFIRLNLPYFVDDDTVNFILKSVSLVAEHGWKLLPQYNFNPETGEWRHKDHQIFRDRAWLGHVSYEDGSMQNRRPAEVKWIAKTREAPTDYEDCCKQALEVFEKANKVQVHLSDQAAMFNEESNKLRWFLLPYEALLCLQGHSNAVSSKVLPFQVVSYPREVLSDTKPRTLLTQDTSKYKDLSSEREHCGDYSESSVRLKTFQQSFKCFVEGSRKSESVDRSLKCVQPPADKLKDDDLQQEKQQPGIGKMIAEDGKTLPSIIASEQGEQSLKQNRYCTVRSLKKAPSKGDRVSPESVTNVCRETGHKWHSPPKNIFKPFVQAIEEYSMIKDGDRILVCLSGGKDSLSLLHSLHQYQFYSKSQGVSFEIGAVTIDPQTSSYDPSPLKNYLAELGIQYFYEEQCILETAQSLPYECESICSFCSRMKRGRIYHTARRENYNVLALGHHLDDLAESFLMSLFYNGSLRTMKACYTVKEGDLRVIRPFVYVREVHLRRFAEKNALPVIAENCPACFEAPKERYRMKQLLATQEISHPRLFSSILSAMKPIFSISRTGISLTDLINDRKESPKEDNSFV